MTTIRDTHVHDNEDGQRLEVEIRVIPADQWEREQLSLPTSWAWTVHESGLVVATHARLKTPPLRALAAMVVPSVN
jgi:hypothetical protein